LGAPEVGALERLGLSPAVPAAKAATSGNLAEVPLAKPAKLAAEVQQAPVKSSGGNMAPPKPSGTTVAAGASTSSSAVLAPELAASSTAFPAELAGLHWPRSFLSEPKGARVEFTEDAARATRESGVGLGPCFLGPMQYENSDGSAYFEVEVLELEAQRSQTMAIGFATSLPAARPLLAERATDLGSGSFLIGYDLPKLYVNGESASKVSGWRPLKELSRGDRVGVLLRQSGGSPELTVYVNGARKVSVSVPGAAEALASRTGSELWGVVDVHGAVRSVRLRRAPAGPSLAGPASLCSTPRAVALGRPLSAASPPPTVGRGVSRALEDGADEAATRPAKRPRLPTFPKCDCTVHLVKHLGDIVHVSNTDFCIGRDTKVVNMALESSDAPNMVSRTHARIVSNDGGVHVIDCRSLNGTWLNGAKVAHHVLKSGDSLVIGNPNQAPPDFRFSVTLPGSS